ncbi:uncharacterized protein N7498_004679 [Penicillium cinerascens]|uniref:Uncharacterized protein n=1 Tax=Penicillium cinerascens TaxID=70096 RepID=A0A9W9MMA3_9EURO|nr:uncharacterized protein N7498_004679 [Penicillium cinerascens]KAJ5203800.1 hypothetical protein N7498_004679 [Penicillium cinerascens]
MNRGCFAPPRARTNWRSPAMLFTAVAHALNLFIGECASPLTFPPGNSVEALPLGRHPPFPGFYGAPASAKAVASPGNSGCAAARVLSRQRPSDGRVHPRVPRPETAAVLYLDDFRSVMTRTLNSLV